MVAPRLHKPHSTDDKTLRQMVKATLTDKNTQRNSHTLTKRKENNKNRSQKMKRAFKPINKPVSENEY